MGIFRKTSVAKEIKEALKTISYLSRAEKYYDLELNKNGKTTKPLLQTIDIVDPLRLIADAVAKFEKGKTDVDAQTQNAFKRCDEIAALAQDILLLNPKTLVSSDKAVLTKLGDYLVEARVMYKAATQQELEEPIAEQTPAGFEEILAQSAPVITPKIEPELYAPSVVTYQPAAQVAPVAEEATPAVEAVKEEAQYEAPAQAAYEAPKAEEPKAEEKPVEQPKSIEELQAVEFEVEKPKVVSINKTKKEKNNMTEKYFATSYAGMNLQEAADIIEALASDKNNLGLVLIEHASEVKPVAQGKEIVAELRALAPIADSFENSTEIENKKALATLKEADRLITICRDIAALSIDGFDKRKQKLLDRFVPQDIAKLAELARVGYPEIFTATDVSGEAIANYLYDLADLLQTNSRELDDELFARALSQIIVQVAQYAEINSLKFKFDMISKKNKVNGKVQELEKRSDIAILRSVTFVPQIARQIRDLEASQRISTENRELIEQALELLQLSYIHARDNYSTTFKDFLKAA
jgi:hypothetical protein